MNNGILADRVWKKALALLNEGGKPYAVEQLQKLVKPFLMRDATLYVVAQDVFGQKQVAETYGAHLEEAFKGKRGLPRRIVCLLPADTLKLEALPPEAQQTALWPEEEIKGLVLKNNAISEGNVLEYGALFVMSSKEARPHHGRGENGALILNKEDYVAVIPILDIDGEKHGEIRVEASVEHGWPTQFADKLLTVVLTKAAKNGWKDPVVPITRYELCRSMGSGTSGADYARLDEAILALYSYRIVFYDLWYDRSQKGRHPGIKPVKLISDFHLPKEGAGEDSEKKGSWIRIGDEIFASAKLGYFLGLDLTYMNELSKMRANGALQLYRYLAKNDGNRAPSYKINLLSLRSKITRSTTMTTSQFRRSLREWAGLLSKPTKDSGKQYLERFEFCRGRNDHELVEFFFRPDDAPGAPKPSGRFN
jgi:hypothetical protein